MHWKDRARRRPVFNDAGHAHELTFCCVDRHPFLTADRACEWLSTSVATARNRFEFAVWAYVFMPEHVHLLVCPQQPEYDIRRILSAIKEPVGRAAMAHLRRTSPEWLARVTVRRGNRVESRFWQPGGGYDRNALEAHTIRSMVEYIHNNPVRRGLVSDPAEWKWSSAGWYAGEGTNSLRPDLLSASELDG